MIKESRKSGILAPAADNPATLYTPNMDFPMAELSKKPPYVVGKPLVNRETWDGLRTQMRWLHDWYMARSNQNILPHMIGIKYETTRGGSQV